MSYRKLEIWQQSRMLVIDIHKMTLTKLPKFEMFEEGSQIRRSVKSVKSSDHLETLFETESLKDQPLYEDLHSRSNTLGRKLNRFLNTVRQSHQSPQ